AEIEAFGSWGADLVGMSTVPEVIAANHCGLEVLGLSCVTNMAAGLQDKLTHEEVIETTEQANDRFAKLLSAILEKI
ncbi:MAG: purine-nucleoside phosphorylase, partial [Candidatus Bipolaricaulota bacterium]